MTNVRHNEPGQPPKARVISVIEVTFTRGDGVAPDPVRQVIAYYAPDGTLLAERDPSLQWSLTVETR